MPMTPTQATADSTVRVTRALTRMTRLYVEGAISKVDFDKFLHHTERELLVAKAVYHSGKV